MTAAPRSHHAPLSPRARLWTAAAVFLATFLALWASRDMGFTRDESFYFKYGESYQEWFVDVEAATSAEATHRAFSRDGVLPIWSGNFEHPPLMKVLFGFAWRHLAHHDRAVTFAPSPTASLTLRARAAPATGFPEGAAVTLLAPLALDMHPEDPTRPLATGRVATRGRDDLTVTLDPGHDAAALKTRCAAPRAGGPGAQPDGAGPRITGCQIREIKALGQLDEATAMRLFGLLSGALAAALTFLLGERFFGWLAGLLASCFFTFVPEHFFHAHVTSFDMPVVAVQMAVLYAFWRSLDDRRWAVATGLLWGVALLTKHNAFFLPVALVLWWLASGRGPTRLSMTRRGLRLPTIPVAFFAMLILGPLMLFVFWPKLWFDPFQAFRDYLQFHLHHEHYMQYWSGEVLQNPPFPFSYPFHKSLLVYPETFTFFLLLAFGLMLAPLRRLGSRPAPSTEAPAAPAGPDAASRLTFLAINGLIPILVIALPSTPIFGGIKHWMPGVPLLAILAGGAFVTVTARARLPRAAELLTALCLVAWPIRASFAHAWVGTGHYNSLLAGGLRGAAESRHMRLFWGYTTRASLAWLNRHAPRNARVFWQNTTPGSYDMYQRVGLLRADIRYHHGADGADLALIDPKQAFFELDLATRRAFDLPAPQHVVTQDGVPFLHVYARPGLLPEAAFGPGGLAGHLALTGPPLTGPRSRAPAPRQPSRARHRPLRARDRRRPPPPAARATQGTPPRPRAAPQATPLKPAPATPAATGATPAEAPRSAQAPGRRGAP
jgi:hypothetical protein